VHIHVAEDAADQRDSAARGGRRVLERLQGAGIMTDRALLAHCVHVGPAEAQIVSSTGATVVCNPRSNMNNAVGHSPFNLVPFQGPRAKVALGTDGIGGDMVTESQVGFFRAKEAELSTPPSWPLARLAEGSRFVGSVYEEALLGTLRPGAPADITVYGYPSPAPLSSENLSGHWVFGLSAGHVRDVYVAGELVVAGGLSTRADQAKLAADGAEVAEKLWQRLEDVPPHEYQPIGGDH
jgi:cytosine/adenosine deaminase-related metal-dependent hydrolase